MNFSYRLAACFLSVGLSVFSGAASAQEAAESPEALVRRITQDIVIGLKGNRSAQDEHQKRQLVVVEHGILPSINFKRMVVMASGGYWQDATPEQQRQLTTEFRLLLVNTYAGALALAKDQQFEFSSHITNPLNTDVIIRARAASPRDEPVQISYRLEKTAFGWKIYDLNIMGIWLMDIHKRHFSSEIGKAGIDGLINLLASKNKTAAGRS